jgi:4-hydroxy-3-methylbut-2-enyl diphosphate reductase
LLHPLVHNEHVSAALAQRSFRTVASVDEIPVGGTLLLSAHGVSPDVRAAARARGVRVVDATCPFVARVHAAVRELAAQGLPIVVIGHLGHVEVAGIVGEIEAAGGRWEAVVSPAEALALAHRLQAAGTAAVGVVSQTTMDSEDVAAIVAGLQRVLCVVSRAAVCQTMLARQAAVRAFDGDALLVVGSPSSSNMRRLCKVARCRAFSAATVEEARALDFSGVSRLGVTSSASTPEELFADVVACLEETARRRRERPA